MRTMHLFAGVGGGLLADLIIGHTPIVAVEWDGYACQVLRERAKDGWFPDLSVWEGDVRMFDPSEYAGKVDCIHAGFPCQDISVAGKQAGVFEGTRSGLYREVLRIADEVRPRFLFLENVAAILSNGLGTVLGDLAALGYDSRWCCLRASDVGAPHHRDRWWMLCANGNNWNRRCQQARHKQPSREAFRESAKNICANVPKGRNVADSERIGLQGSWESVHAEHSAKTGDWETIEPVNGGFRDFWRTEPGLGRVAHGVPNRVGQLKGYGNAQVPLQAAVAWKLLGGE